MQKRIDVIGTLLSVQPTSLPGLLPTGPRLGRQGRGSMTVHTSDGRDGKTSAPMVK